MKPVPDRVIALDDNRHAGGFSGPIVLRELLARDDEAIE
jgi:hypothetical protein